MATTAKVLETRTTSGGEQAVRGYRPELDVVRFLAFLLVFACHLISTFSLRSREVAGFLGVFGAGSWHFLMLLDETCAMGLCLFFTLSAYLITDLLLAERENYSALSVRKFYIRRALRIWPLYFFGIGVGIAEAATFQWHGQTIAFAWYLAFAGNIFIAAFGGFANPMMPLWSISVEEQFYLVWPWAVRWFSKRGLAFCALFFLLAANITLFFLARRHADTDTTVWANTFVQFEMFATGILLALSKKRLAWRNPRIGLALVVAGPVLWFVACSTFHAKQPAAVVPVVSAPSLMAGYALIALGCASVLQGFCMIGPARMPRWAARQGKISYGLYVFHGLATQIAVGLLDQWHGLIFLAGSTLLALLLVKGLATLSYDYLETPFLKLKRRFEIVHSRPV